MSYVVIDTGCERMATGPDWLEQHTKRMETWGYKLSIRVESEFFTFGGQKEYK